MDLPLLVPSFSSKGFASFDEDGSTRSEAWVPFQAVNPVLQESFLVSAYDLHHEFIPASKAMLSNAEIVLIDSGGYETSPFFDATEPMFRPFAERPFDLDDYRAVLEGLDASLPVVVASPDWHTKDQAIGDQIAFAQEFLADFRFTRSLIIKPGSKTHVRASDVAPHVEALNAFDIVGVTEKELGRNLKDRLKTVAQLRSALDEAGLRRIPIHVWGGLDPIITPLYFFAGAEIFDGLSWLRYAFYRGMALYRDAWQILDGGATRSFDHARMELWFKNLSELRRLTQSLRMFERGGRVDFGAFEWNRAPFERAFNELSADIPSIQGGQ